MPRTRGTHAGGCGWWFLASLWVIFLSLGGTWLGLWLWNRAHPCPCTMTARPAALPMPTLTPTLLVFPYLVQPGDTLEALAQRFGVARPTLEALNGLAQPTLQPGQMLWIPGTPPVSAQVPSQVRIQNVEAPGRLEEEGVQIVNTGPYPVRLLGWRLEDADGHVFQFPDITLYPQGGLWVWSRPGVHSPVALYWGRREAVFRIGERLTLRDAQGNVVDTYTIRGGP